MEDTIPNKKKGTVVKEFRVEKNDASVARRFGGLRLMSTSNASAMLDMSPEEFWDCRDPPLLSLSEHSMKFWEREKKLLQDGVTVAVTAQVKTCRNCRKEVDSVRRCSACHLANYCGRPCQENDWPVHQAECKEWRRKPVDQEENDRFERFAYHGGFANRVEPSQ
jgi:hypothetical protein